VDVDSNRWNEIRASEHEWERKALAWVRSQLPDHEPWRAWSNFEFIADDGTISEVDLLILGPRGVYLVEIKSWPGSLRGDAGTWVQTQPGKPARSYDNPRLLTDRKAKRLKSLIQRQKPMHAKGVDSNFFIEALVFL
jgi:nuclease-like protein